MNGDCRVHQYDEDEDGDANARQRCLSVIEEEDGNRELEQEENAITELNDVAVLSSSKNSLRKKKVSEEEEMRLKKKQRLRLFFERIPLKGFLLSLMCSIVNSIATIFSKLVVNLSATDISLIRYLIQFTSMIIIIKYKGASVFGPKKHRPLIIFRAFIGTFGVISFFFALKLLDPSDCLTITHTSVIITAILARIFLKEKLNFTHVIAIVLTAVGVFLISKPKSIFSKLSTPTALNNSVINSTLPQHTTVTEQSSVLAAIGVATALLCAASSGIAQVTLKRLSTLKVHFSNVLVSTAIVGIPISLLISIVLTLGGYAHKDFQKNRHLIPMEILYAIIGCSLGTLSQVMLNISLQYEEASKVAIYLTLNVFLTFLTQYLILNIKADIFSIIGSCAIIAGTFLILSFKLIQNKKKNTNKPKPNDTSKSRF